MFFIMMLGDGMKIIHGRIDSLANISNCKKLTSKGEKSITYLNFPPCLARTRTFFNVHSIIPLFKVGTLIPRPNIKQRRPTYWKLNHDNGFSCKYKKKIKHS